MDEVYVNIYNEGSWIKKHFNDKDLVTISEMLGVIEDLDSEVERLKEQIEDREQEIKDNYRRIPVEEQVGVRERDFICE